MRYIWEKLFVCKIVLLASIVGIIIKLLTGGPTHRLHYSIFMVVVEENYIHNVEDQPRAVAKNVINYLHRLYKCQINFGKI